MPISGGKHGFQVSQYYHTVLIPNATSFVPPDKVVIQNAVLSGVAIVAVNVMTFTSGVVGNLDDIFQDLIVPAALAFKGPHNCEGTDNRYFNNTGVGRTIHAWGLQYA